MGVLLSSLSVTADDAHLYFRGSMSCFSGINFLLPSGSQQQKAAYSGPPFNIKQADKLHVNNVNINTNFLSFPYTFSLLGMKGEKELYYFLQ